MFKTRYWREYPLFLQMLLLVLMMFSLFSFSFAIIQLVIPSLMHVKLEDITSIDESKSRNIIDAAMVFQCITSMASFLIPALLFSYLTHPRPAVYLGLSKKGKPLQFLLVILIMLGLLPLVLGIESLNKMVDLGPWANKMQEENERAFKALLKMDTFADFMKVFSILAILPALAEEMIFRGIIMRAVNKRTKNTAAAIAITALIFAIVHFNPYGLFAIFLAAIVLGYIYYLTGSLWLSILTHMVNNGLQIVLYYLANDNPTVKAFVDSEHIPASFIAGGAVLFAASFYMLWKFRTPLPSNWSDDFTKEELTDKAK